MSDLKAEKLRDWLHGLHDGSEVDVHVREAVYVLAPHRAPAPSKSIEALFSTLTSGPLAASGHDVQEESYEREQQLLRRSKKENDLIPKRSIEDVFAQLKEGPLATLESVEQESSNVVPLHSAAAPESVDAIPPKKRSWSVWGTLIAVAAMVFVGIQYPALQQATSPALNESMQFTEAPSEKHTEEREPAPTERPAISVPEEPKPAASKSSLEDKDSSNVPFTGGGSAGPKLKKRKKVERQAKSKRKPKQEKKIEQESSAQILDAEEEGGIAISSKEEVGSRIDAKPSSARATVRDPLDVLRMEALRGEQIPSTAEMNTLSLEALKVGIQDPNTDRAFSAAYEIARRFPSQRTLVESMLRLKGVENRKKRFLHILLGDSFRAEGKRVKAEENYRKALLLPD